MKTELTDEQKNELRATAADVAEKGADHAAEKAKNSTGWVKILWIILAVLFGAAAFFLETGCGQITQEQMQVAGQVVHEIYHVAHPDKPCLAAAPSAARPCGAQAKPVASHPTSLQVPCILVLPVDDIDK